MNTQTGMIILLGRAALITHGGACVPLSSRKSAMLLARLLVSRQGVLNRQIIMDALWPDSEPQLQRAAFNTEVWRLRALLKQAFGMDHALTTQADVLIMNTVLFAQSDIARFRSALGCLSDCNLSAKLHAEAAHDIDCFYTGQLLPAEHDEWVCGMREILRGQYMEALTLRMKFALQASDWQALRELALRLIGEDAFLEHAYRDLMRAHVALGNRSAALSYYDHLRKLLLAELGVAPMRETRVLAEAIRQQGDTELIVPHQAGAPKERVDVPVWLSRIAGEMEALSRSLRTE